jgi:hypothetical protein
MVYKKIEIGEATRAEDIEAFTVFMQNPGALTLIVSDLYYNITIGEPAKKKDEIVTLSIYPDVCDKLIKKDFIIESNKFLYLTNKGLRIAKKHLYVP